MLALSYAGSALPPEVSKGAPLFRQSLRDTDAMTVNGPPAGRRSIHEELDRARNDLHDLVATATTADNAESASHPIKAGRGPVT